MEGRQRTHLESTDGVGELGVEVQSSTSIRRLRVDDASWRKNVSSERSALREIDRRTKRRCAGAAPTEPYERSGWCFLLGDSSSDETEELLFIF